MSNGFKIIMTLFVISLGVLIFWIKSNEITDSKNDEAIVFKRDIVNSRLISGIIMPSKEVKVVSHISGIITEIYKKEGEFVKEGDSIAKIKIIASPEAVENAKRNYKLSEVKNNYLEIDYKRQEELYKKGVVPRIDFENIESQYKQSKEELFSAKKQLDIIKKGYTKGVGEIDDIIRSTTDGFIIDLPIEIGSSVINRNNFNEGSPIAVVVDLKNLIFKAKIAENDIWILENTDTFITKVPSLENKSFNTRLNKIASKGVEENNIVFFDFEGELDMKTESIPKRLGYTGVAEVIISEAYQVPSIEVKDVFFINDSSFVNVYDDDDAVQKVYIEVGVCDGVYCEVKKGLKENDRILLK